MKHLSVDYLWDKRYESEMRTRFWGMYANKYRKRLLYITVAIAFAAFGEVAVILAPDFFSLLLLPVFAGVCAALGWMLSQSDWHEKHKMCSQAYMLWGQAAEFYKDLYERAEEGEEISRAEIAGVEKILTGLATQTRVAIGKPDNGIISDAEKEAYRALGVADQLP